MNLPKKSIVNKKSEALMEDKKPTPSCVYKIVFFVIVIAILVPIFLLVKSKDTLIFMRAIPPSGYKIAIAFVFLTVGTYILGVELKNFWDKTKSKFISIGKILLVGIFAFSYVIMPYYTAIQKPIIPTGEEIYYLKKFCDVSTSAIKRLIYYEHLPIGQPITPSDITNCPLSFLYGYAYYAKGDLYINFAIIKYDKAIEEFKEENEPSSMNPQESCAYYLDKAGLYLNLGFACTMGQKEGKAIEAFYESVVASKEAVGKDSTSTFNGYAAAYNNLGILSFSKKINETEERKGEDFLWEAINLFTSEKSPENQTENPCDLAFYCLLHGYKNQLENKECEKENIKNKLKKLVIKAQANLPAKNLDYFSEKVNIVLNQYFDDISDWEEFL